MGNAITLQKCEECSRFFDSSNNNFFMNLAISKFKKEKTIPGALLEALQDNINKSSEIDWCTCHHEKKMELAEEANANFDTLFTRKKGTFDIKKIGLDFTINKDIVYIENNKFSESDFLKYCKSIKQKLTNSIFDFDFISHDKMDDELFLKNYKNYYVQPNFLLINDLHQIKENQVEELKAIVSIVRERLSNNKRTFILLKQDIEAFAKTLKANNWSKNELIYSELINLIEDKFARKLITLSEKNEKIAVNTLDYEISKPKKKVSKGVEGVKNPKKSEPLGDFD